mgnify:CR=1 FL=1
MNRTYLDKQLKRLADVVKTLNWVNLPEYLTDLSPREHDIISMRFGLEDGTTHTLEEVGKKHGVTRERIRQIEQRVFEKIIQKVETKTETNQ